MTDIMSKLIAIGRGSRDLDEGFTITIISEPSLQSASDLDKAKLALALLESMQSPRTLAEGTMEWDIDHAKRLLQGALEL